MTEILAKKNSYPGHCSGCGERVGVGDGLAFLHKERWRTACGERCISKAVA